MVERQEPTKWVILKLSVAFSEWNIQNEKPCVTVRSVLIWMIRLTINCLNTAVSGAMHSFRNGKQSLKCDVLRQQEWLSDRQLECCSQDCPRKSFKDVNIWDLVWHLKEILFTHSSYWSNNIPCLAHLCFSPPLINDLTYFRLLKNRNQNYFHNLDNRDSDLLSYLIGYIISTFYQEFNNIPMGI